MRSADMTFHGGMLSFSVDSIRMRFGFNGHFVVFCSSTLTLDFQHWHALAVYARTSYLHVLCSDRQRLTQLDASSKLRRRRTKAFLVTSNKRPPLFNLASRRSRLTTSPSVLGTNLPIPRETLYQDSLLPPHQDHLHHRPRSHTGTPPRHPPNSTTSNLI